MNAANRNKGGTPFPPEKGSFPLDHDGECKEQMRLYVSCVRANGGKTLPCDELKKTYLICRMDNGLMAKEELKDLGFRS